MASSPPSNFTPSMSPPYPPHITIPTATVKRRSTDNMPTSAPAAKRRKQSMLSTTSTSHPLRQTSFPPSEADPSLQYSPSPSIDGVSMTSSNNKRGTKSRKSSGKRKANDDDTASLVSGRGLLSVKSGRTGGARGSKEPSRGRSTGADVEEEEDVDDDGDVGMGLAADTNTNQDFTPEGINLRRAILREAMEPRHQDRFDAWHASRLNNATVKKLVNQTLSQSVPETVVFAIKIAAKLFAGEMVERARKVREQWMRVSIETQIGRLKPVLGLPSPPAEDSSLSSQPSTSSQSQRADSNSQSQIPDSSNDSEDARDASRKRVNKIMESCEFEAQLRAPLTSRHLEEAFRRYKECDGPDREMLNVWRAQRSSGAERFGVKNRRGQLFGGGRLMG